jgi:hypothetical protein
VGNLRLLGGSVKTHLSDDETVAKMGHPDFRCGPPFCFRSPGGSGRCRLVDSALLQVGDGFGAGAGFAAVADISSR